MPSSNYICNDFRSLVFICNVSLTQQHTVLKNYDIGLFKTKIIFITLLAFLPTVYFHYRQYLAFIPHSLLTFTPHSMLVGFTSFLPLELPRPFCLPILQSESASNSRSCLHLKSMLIFTLSPQSFIPILNVDL